MDLLKVDRINVYYGDVHILRDFSIEVGEKEIVSIVGGNGTGKTTLMKTLSGLLKTRTGKVVFRDREIQSSPPYEIARLGIAQVMEGRRLFPFMTIEENLLMGAYPLTDKALVRKNLGEIFQTFPILQKKKTSGPLL